MTTIEHPAALSNNDVVHPDWCARSLCFLSASGELIHREDPTLLECQGGAFTLTFGRVRHDEFFNGVQDIYPLEIEVRDAKGALTSLSVGDAARLVAGLTAALLS